MADLHAFVEARLHDDRAYAATNEGGPWKHLDHWVDRQWPMVRRHDGCGDDCITMRCLAEIWKGHPDYDAEWSNTVSDDRCEGCGLIPDYCSCDLPGASAFVDYTQRLAESEKA